MRSEWLRFLKKEDFTSPRWAIQSEQSQLTISVRLAQCPPDSLLSHRHVDNGANTEVNSLTRPSQRCDIARGAVGPSLGKRSTNATKKDLCFSQSPVSDDVRPMA